MSRLGRLSAYLLSSVAALAWGGSAQAQSLLSPVPMSDQTQAVSAFNGQWRLELGASDYAGALFRATGSLTTPVGDNGFQGDFSLTHSQAGDVVSATFHAFARDPSSWMLGITQGVVISNDAALAAIGIEGELYLDRFSLETWAGLAGVNYADPGLSDTGGLFFFGDAVLYATEDLRLVLGGSSVLGVNQLHFGTEYLLRDLNLPISLVADARVGSGGSIFTVGLHGYFGGDDETKSLILRHREDNLRLRSLDLFGASADIPFREAGPPDFVDPEVSQENCEVMGGEWFGSFCDVTFVEQPECEWIAANVPFYAQNGLYWDENVDECLFGGA
ncbi:MAG: hypothetical protein ABIO40_03670 [Devosia sp.]